MKNKPIYWCLLVMALSMTSCVAQKSISTTPVEPERTFQQDPATTIVYADTAETKVPLAQGITPTFTLQFQFMELDGDEGFTQAAADADSSVAQANRYFKGAIEFNRDPIIYTFDSEGKEIYDLYDDFAGNPAEYDRWTAERYVDSAITIFVMPTGVKNEQILLGFCPVIHSGFEFYEEEWPRFDHMFVSYRGLADASTLGHELGHYFGLGHVFSMTDKELKAFGLSDEQIQRINVMNYGSHPEELTDEQIFVAWKMAVTARAYRLD